MGINVRVQDAPKQSGIIAAQVNLEKDLRSCMRCKGSVSGKRASLKSRKRTKKACALDARTNNRKGIVFPA